MKVGECKQCGVCCKVVVLPFPMEQIKKIYADNEKGISISGEERYNYEFAILNFISIEADEAFKKNPNLIELHHPLYTYYYMCKKFNNSINKCGCYEIRPGTCKNYPWYGREPYDKTFLTDDCGYKLDKSYFESLPEIKGEDISKDESRC